MTTVDDRRRFTRIHFDAECEVRTARATCIMQLEDVSMRGVLLQTSSETGLTLGDEVEINIYLANDVLIRIRAELRHIDAQRYGFFAREMDLESASHLRRLLELNLGEEALIERELEHLFEPDQI